MSDDALTTPGDDAPAVPDVSTYGIPGQHDALAIPSVGSPATSGADAPAADIPATPGGNYLAVPGDDTPAMMLR